MKKLKFKIGDKVRLNPSKVTQADLDEYSSDGEFDKIYIIDIREKHSILQYHFIENNWHNGEWLVSVYIKNIVGGKLLE